VKALQPFWASHRCVRLLQNWPVPVQPQVMVAPVQTLVFVVLHSLSAQTCVLKQQLPASGGTTGVVWFVLLQMPPLPHGQARLVVAFRGNAGEGPTEHPASAVPLAP
jgi:hypothetical protein